MKELSNRELSNRESLEMMKNFIYVSIISSDNDEYPEEVKQRIISRYHEVGSKDWSYVLEPLGEDKYKYLKILAA